MKTIDLLFAVAAAWFLMMIVLQTVLNKRVHPMYIYGLPGILVIWILVSRVLL